MSDLKAVHCGTLIDGVADEPISDAVVVIEDDRITAVGPRESVSVPEAADSIDHSAQVVTPGFIDAHVHLDGTRSFSPMERISSTTAFKTARAAADLQPLLDAGFTSVRDLGSSAALGLRDVVNEGELSGPRIFTSGRAFSQTGGHADIHSLQYEWVKDDPHSLGGLADGVDECRREVRKELRKGVDCVKIMTSGGMASERDDPDDVFYTPAEIQAFTEEAHRVGVPVASHANGPGATVALENGVDTVEHAIGIEDRAIDLAKETDGTVVPTLSAIYRLANEGDEHGLAEFHVRKGQEFVGEHAASIQRAYEGGAAIALGTDCNGSTLHPHGDNAVEFELLVEQAGLTEMDAIKAGTSNAARTIPEDDVGSIEPGNYADLVVLDEDPLDDIGATRHAISTVYKGGVAV
jgi:imidazolonepropionase-like amidohydrolase